MWFSYDPENGFEVHDTEEEARQRIESALEDCIDYAGWNGEWPDYVANLCWGEVRGEVRERIISGDGDVVDYVVEEFKHGN